MITAAESEWIMNDNVAKNLLKSLAVPTGQINCWWCDLEILYRHYIFISVGCLKDFQIEIKLMEWWTIIWIAVTNSGIKNSMQISF